MRYLCLTCDYDGTIARDGRVLPSTLEALKRVSASGRKLVLATGRELDDLFEAFPEVSIFDRVVAENGALLYRPHSKEQRVLGERPPREFVEELVRRGVSPLSVGQSIVATWHPNEATVLEVIRTQGLELQVIFNKNAVMILPAGVNKGTGVNVALEELELSAHNVVGAGDAENDHAFLALCECSVAVTNALPALKERADVVTNASHGLGVEELIEKLLAEDLLGFEGRLQRHRILVGRGDAAEEHTIEPYGSRLLIAGPSGSGKSTTVSGIVERLIENEYQVCLIDPEGDYDRFDKLLTLGGPDRIPATAEVLETLKDRRRSLSINLLGVPLADRPAFCQTLLSRIRELRSKTGRPHWIVLDEAHHLLPKALDSVAATVPQELESFALITVHPDHVSPVILNTVNGIIAVGPEPHNVIAQFVAATGKKFSDERPSPACLEPGHVLFWVPLDSEKPANVIVEPAKAELRRHRRKYAAGELGTDKSFFFRGPQGSLNLRAQNMNVFAQMAQGVDEDTWSYHLRNSDYSRWLRESVKDNDLANEVAAIENDESLGPVESRALIVEAIQKHYTGTA
jgi:HAD superfamily hydrolase (TIGR01484 family)